MLCSVAPQEMRSAWIRVEVRTDKCEVSDSAVGLLGRVVSLGSFSIVVYAYMRRLLAVAVAQKQLGLFCQRQLSLSV